MDVAIILGVIGLLYMIVQIVERRSGRPIEQTVRGWLAKRKGESDPDWEYTLDTIVDLKTGSAVELPGDSGWEYLTWSDSFLYKADGDFVRTIECMALNVADEPKDKMVFVQFSDGSPTKIWARQGRKDRDVLLMLDEGTEVAKFTIPLAGDVAPGGTAQMRYGYTLEGWAEAGSDHWEKIVRSPHHIYKAKLSAEKPWAINAPKASVLTMDRQPVAGEVPPVRTRLGKTYWTVHRPQQATRLRLEWNTVNTETLSP